MRTTREKHSRLEPFVLRFSSCPDVHPLSARFAMKKSTRSKKPGVEHAADSKPAEARSAAVQSFPLGPLSYLPVDFTGVTEPKTAEEKLLAEIQREKLALAEHLAWRKKWIEERRPFWAADDRLRAAEEKFRKQLKLAGLPTFSSSEAKKLLKLLDRQQTADLKHDVFATRLQAAFKQPKKRAATKVARDGWAALATANSALREKRWDSVVAAAVELGIAVGRLMEKNRIGGGNRKAEGEKRKAEMRWLRQIDDAFLSFMRHRMNHGKRFGTNEARHPDGPDLVPRRGTDGDKDNREDGTIEGVNAKTTA
jgi:ElaB/YqjD/DUF883 family membrane-anchored ribosome-binding protein